MPTCCLAGSSDRLLSVCGLSELVAGQHAMRIGRKAIAQDFIVQKQILSSELHEMTRAQQREAYNAEQRRLLQQKALEAAGESPKLKKTPSYFPAHRGGQVGGRRSAAF
jgi:hypothetical protein